MNFKKLALLCSLVVLASCAKQTVYVADKPMDYDVSKTSHFFLWGIGQTSKVDVARICKSRNNVSKVESRMSGGQAVVTLLTFGIYTPMTSTVYCSKEVNQSLKVVKQ
ncbi:MAG TPA: lipoprotein bor [Alphaproteobacteria bacterium]|mgnify:CR=1 FL=1|nr:lipoprotein bor [Alphaproteobacteria bacterium]